MHGAPYLKEDKTLHLHLGCFFSGVQFHTFLCENKPHCTHCKLFPTVIKHAQDLGFKVNKGA